jgi:putative membrane protein
MKLHIVALAAGTALSLAACGKHDNGNSAADGSNIALDNSLDGNAMAPAADPNSAQGFVNAAAASDRFEIESSKLAQTSASSAAVKKFAGQMITDHTASTAKLKGILGGMTPSITPDDTPTPDQQTSLDGLKGQSGAAFDSAYKQAQVDGHQKTLDLLKSYAANGDNAQLKSFAQGLIPKVTAHLNMAKGLK